MADNWLFTVAYDGSSYAGWQVQPGQFTIQGQIERRLSSLYRTPIRIIGPSRTDAGVHALGQTFSLTPPPSPEIPAANLLLALNHGLPPDIRARDVTDVPMEFHARHHAIGKIYTYVIHTGPMRSPFVHRYCWSIVEPLSLERMRSAAGMLVGEHDFTRFSVVTSGVKQDPVKRLDKIDIRPLGDFIVISVTGNSFLYRMVRRMVGFLTDVGSGRIAPERTREMLTGKESESQFDTAPPSGLYLERVFYERVDMESYEPVGLPFLRLAECSEH